mmetsp:Transcript_23971/g.61188  ORF Transcript_23971/g.61188 Transcript_23971/m.61188 type:complete len:183 (-) Transcript_23971:222-770(-)
MKRSHDEVNTSAPAPAAVTEQLPPPQPSELQYANLWYYDDVEGNQQGPFSSQDMRGWFTAGYLPTRTPIAPSWYGEVPVVTWPIDRVWETPSDNAFVMAEDAQVIATTPMLPDFLRSDMFAGAREGYCFKTDDNTYGTGYYRDKPPPIEITYDTIMKEIEERKAKLSSFKSVVRPPSSPTRR